MFNRNQQFAGMKILLVDDEQIERQGLELILQRNFEHIEVHQVKSGNAAIEYCASIEARHLPDLVLMDIQMPGLNGLETIEQLNTLYADMKFIMVTAYDQFDYAKQAIKAGVLDYLLKPSKASEIVTTVAKALHTIQSQRKGEQQLSRAMSVLETDVVSQLLFDRVHDVHLDELVSLMKMDAMPQEAYALVVTIAEQERADLHYAQLKIRAHENANCWVGALYGQQIPIIVFPQSVSIDRATTQRAQAQSLARQFIQSGAQLIGIGPLVHNIQDIRKSYQQALMAALSGDRQLTQGQTKTVRHYADIHHQSNEGGNGAPVPAQQSMWIELARTGKWEQIKANLHDYIQRQCQQWIDLIVIQQRVLEVLWLIARTLLEKQVNVTTPMFAFQAADVRQLTAESDRLLNQLIEQYKELHVHAHPDVMRRVKQFINQRAHQEVSLELISHEVGLSPFYLSKLFKEQLGMNYIDYLTELRITKAKKLMQQPELSMKEIAYEVGYHDPNYFSKVFKRITGLTPKEYRVQL